VFAISFVISTIVMSIYNITSITLLQCFYTDVDICNQLRRSYIVNTNRPKEMENIVLSLMK